MPEIKIVSLPDSLVLHVRNFLKTCRFMKIMIMKKRKIYRKSALAVIFFSVLTKLKRRLFLKLNWHSIKWSIVYAHYLVKIKGEKYKWLWYMYPRKANSYNDMTSLKNIKFNYYFSNKLMTRNFTIRVKRILKINPNMFEMIHVDITLQLIQGNCT